MRVLVVCGLSETMASLVPTSRFSSVDLPAFGRPMNETNPDFIRPFASCRRVLGVLGALAAAADPHLVDPPPLGVEHLDASARRSRTARRPPARGRGATADSRRRSRTLRARSATFSRCATSSMSTLPLNTKRPSPSSTIGSDSTSYSSRISPTISSSRSSIVTRPAVPPYSSTTIAHLRLLALELLQQLGHPLGFRHDHRRPQQRRDRPASSSVLERDQILHEDEARRCCRGCPCRPGTASTPARGTARAGRRSSPSRGCATMSGRGVITSRTSVSPKSTMLCSSRRSSPSMMPSCSAVSRYALAASLGFFGRLVRRRRRRRRASASARSARSSASSGRAPGRPARTTAAAARARAPDRGRRSAAAAAARRRRRSAATRRSRSSASRAPSTPIAARQQRGRRRR